MSNIEIADVVQRIQYTAGVGQTNFAIPFVFLANADITAYNDDTLLVLATNYTLAGAGNPAGGTLTLNVAAAGGEIITILGTLTVDRTSIYTAALNRLTGSDLNSDFNRDIIMIKQREMRESYLMLQYQPYAAISQNINVTTDRWLPLLPAGHVWRKNDANTEIVTTDLPAIPGGLSGEFTQDNRLVKTDTDGGADNLLQQTDMVLTDGNDLSNSGGSWSISSGANFTVTTVGNYVLNGVQYPKLATATVGTVLGVTGAGVADWVAVPGGGAPVLLPVVDNAIARFHTTSGMIQNSELQISDLGATIANFVDVITTNVNAGINFLPNGTGETRVKADPVSPLGIATKQYVDDSGATQYEVNQNNHNFAFGEVIYNNAGTYTSAQADAAATANPVGVVSEVIDIDNFKFLQIGILSGFAGLTPGEENYLSTTVAGGVQNTVPTNPGEVIKEIWIVLNATTVLVTNKLGVEI